MTFKGNWYCLYTKAGQEKLAQSNLLNQGFEVYLPLMIKRVKRKERFIEVKKPLFTSYVFASAPEEEVQKFRSTRGVSYPLSSKDGQALVLDHSILEAIDVYCPEGIFTESIETFKKGEQIELTDGPLRGADALFQKSLSNKNRAIILVSLLCNEFEVEVDLATLQKKED